MFDIGWTELLVIGVVALIVVGPKDLPGIFRTLGRFTAKARGMAREFQRAMESAADETGMKDVAKDLKSATSAKNLGLDTLKDAATKFESWDPRRTAPAKPDSAKPDATKAGAPKPDAVAKVESGAAAMGDETRALAEAQAAKRAERAAEAAARRAAAKPDAAEPAADTATEPAAEKKAET